MKTLLTGSSRGIGKSIAELLLDNGYEVIGVSTSTNNQYTKNQYRHTVCDLSNPAEVNKLKQLFTEDEVPEVLINNAGIFMEAQFEDSDEDWMTKWDKTQQVNLRSMALISKWAINAWKERGIEGRIINIASRAGVRGDTGEYAAYAASKAGMIAFTKSIARSLGKDGITAYSIAPGFVNTDMAQGSIEVYGEEYLTKDLVLDSIAPPEQIAEMVLLLASGKLTHATGQTFHINSGSYLV
ncbi:MAG: SDR family oxidoreductase [Balneola sp.]|jgi:3-oxoacyl-[acyl-carrier protein] reductase|nr:SDR family oxidoreductase [Balneola sp.]MAO78252.1 SDR family oxidoreductase [Balneola sp.]MBF64253.1 SDR family oxidoreductase [Balneola sp.]HAW79997.1 SDR family oxidoreductase [Balneola sp.]|tara:strand:- start:33500 stop:34219 length:720 start_codon:yes stop_codon:yes gene_type:complete